MSVVANLPFALTPPAAPVGDAASDSDLPEATLVNRVPILAKLFSYGLPTRAPGDQRRMHSVLQALLSSPIPDGLRHKREEESRRLASEFDVAACEDEVDAEAEAVGSSSQQPLMYLLSPNRMIDNDYHLPTYLPHGDNVYIPGAKAEDLPTELRELLSHDIDVAKSVADEAKEAGADRKGAEEIEDGWVETAKATAPPPSGKWPVLALDCEMASPSLRCSAFD